jgi:hypothetical protein
MKLRSVQRAGAPTQAAGEFAIVMNTHGDGVAEETRLLRD